MPLGEPRESPHMKEYWWEEEEEEEEDDDEIWGL
jgi:hypothetical protein